MALTEIPSELSSTPSIVDNGNATAITIGSDESATFAGSVGIGTAPTSQLEIDESGSGDATIKVGNAQNVYTTNVGKQGATAYGATAAGAAFLYTFDNDISIMSDGSGGSIKFTTGGNTQKMELDASGNLLVGQSSTTLPGVDNTTAGVSIRGHDGSFFSRILGSGDANNVVSINRSTADGNILGFQKDGASVGSIGVDNNDNFQIGATTSGHAGLYFGNGSVAPMAGNSRVQDTVDLGNATYRWKDLYLSGVANVGSIVQTGSTSSLVASFENTNTSGYGMRITTYSSGVEYALAVDSYGGGYSRDFVIGVNGYIYSPPTYALTTASAANMHISSAGGLLFRSTSSARYKNTITDATHGLTELLTLRPVTYKGNNDGDTVFGGLIAEEVHDAGLTEFVQYNEEDQPDALAYGNMVSLCIKAIQELKEELNTATARITELENN